MAVESSDVSAAPDTFPFPARISCGLVDVFNNGAYEAGQSVAVNAIAAALEPNRILEKRHSADALPPNSRAGLMASRSRWVDLDARDAFFDSLARSREREPRLLSKADSTLPDDILVPGIILSYCIVQLRPDDGNRVECVGPTNFAPLVSDRRTFDAGSPWCP